MDTDGREGMDEDGMDFGMCVLGSGIGLSWGLRLARKAGDDRWMTGGAESNLS